MERMKRILCHAVQEMSVARVSGPLIKAFKVEIATVNVTRDSPATAVELTEICTPLVFSVLTEKICH